VLNPGLRKRKCIILVDGHIQHRFKQCLPSRRSRISRTHRGSEKLPGMMNIMGLIIKLESIEKSSSGKWVRI